MERLQGRIAFEGVHGVAAVELFDTIPQTGPARGRPHMTTKHTYVVGFDPHVSRGGCDVELAVLAPEGAQIDDVPGAYRHMHVVLLEELGQMLEHSHGMRIEIAGAL